MVFEIPPTSAAATPRPLWLGIGGVMLALLVACLVGILSRIGNFPAFWPANAVLLGLLLRHAHLARRPVTWACMWLVYVLADLVTGSSLFVALTLNTANIVGVLCGWLFLYRQGIQKQGFQRQRAVLVMFCGCLLYAVSSALVGTWPSHVAFGTPLWRVLLMWIATEFCNCVLVLPVILSAPRGWVWQWKSPVNFHSWHYVLPLGALLLTEVLSRVFHGPGSVAFVIPSLVWCGLAYGVFATAQTGREPRFSDRGAGSACLHGSRAKIAGTLAAGKPQRGGADGGPGPLQADQRPLWPRARRCGVAKVC